MQILGRLSSLHVVGDQFQCCFLCNNCESTNIKKYSWPHKCFAFGIIFSGGNKVQQGIIGPFWNIYYKEILTNSLCSKRTFVHNYSECPYCMQCIVNEWRMNDWMWPIHAQNVCTLMKEMSREKGSCIWRLEELSFSMQLVTSAFPELCSRLCGHSKPRPEIQVLNGLCGLCLLAYKHSSHD